MRDLIARREVVKQFNKDRERISVALDVSNPPISITKKIKGGEDADIGEAVVLEIIVQETGISINGGCSANGHFASGNISMSDSIARDLYQKLKELYEL